MATVTLSNDGGTADVSVMPGRVGSNVIDIVLHDVEGRVINPYEAPVVELLVARVRDRATTSGSAAARDRALPGERRPQLRRELGAVDPRADRRVRIGRRHHHVAIE